MIPSVAASERGLAQTKELAPWGCRTSHMELQRCVVRRRGLERPAIEGKSPVAKSHALSETDPEYGGTRETPSESGRTICQG